MNIEVEVRSFISQEQYNELLFFFNTQAEFIKEDEQESYYFDSEQDLRIQKNNFHAKIWLKKGKIHDDCREEIEIKFDRNQFDELQELFTTLGYQVNIKWFRKRIEFNWNGISVCLDDTKGYGRIIELEKITTEDKKTIIHRELMDKLASLNIHISSKDEFNERYEYYKINWRTLI